MIVVFPTSCLRLCGDGATGSVCGRGNKANDKNTAIRPPSEVELARQREVAMAVVDRAARLFKALAKR